MKPVVAVVGRPNVGKSALFNRICGRQISLVFDRPGVTRDRITAECVWEGKPFTLVDTGGIGLEDESGFEEAIRREVEIALQAATDILLVVDARAGRHPLDEEVARRLRQGGRRAVLVVNKVDEAETSGWEGEFERLGLDPIFPVSAAHGRGVEVLMRHLSRDWPTVEAAQTLERSRPVRVAVVGRPNAGKSSLINALLGEERVIVSPLAGTTRDAVDVPFERNGRQYCLMDTAGMRRKARIADPLETLMSGRSAHTINRADVCVLVLDAVHGVGVQEKKIAGLIQEARKPCLILINKWDLARGVKTATPESKPHGPSRGGKHPESADFRQQYLAAVREHLFFLHYAPVEMVSALEKAHLSRWVDALERVGQARATELAAGPLNRLIEKCLKRHPPAARGGRPLKIYYVAQVKDAPCHTLAAFINDRALWTDDYARYLERHIREAFFLEGCPLVWEVRDKSGPARSRRARSSKSRESEAGVRPAPPRPSPRVRPRPRS